MHIFLTGGTGFIGQALVRTLRARGWAVTALVRDPRSEGARWMAGKGVVLTQGDVTEPAGLAKAMAGCDVVLHNAGVYELGVDARLAQRMQAVNVAGTDHVLAAAREAGVPRSVHVSSVVALGPTGDADRPSERQGDESTRHPGDFRTPYERSKHEAHQVALRHRQQGLALNIVMPNGVAGINDHSVWGYFLRLYLLRGMPPTGWGRDCRMGFVEAGALAEGICRVIEKAPPGEDYVFSGPAISAGQFFDKVYRAPGGLRIRLWLPRAIMAPQMALMEPLLRSLKLPVFLSRDTVAASRVHYDFSSAKAQRELGWTHPDPDRMWDAIVTGERALMMTRKGWLNRLRHQAVVPD